MQFGSDEHDVGYIARMQVRQWLMTRTDLFRFEVAPLLVGRHALAARVNVEAFDVAIRTGISGEQTLPTILELIAEIADTSATLPFVDNHHRCELAITMGAGPNV